MPVSESKHFAIPGALCVIGLASALTSACITEDPTTSVQSQPQWTVSSVPASAITEDEPMLAIARALPSFGGFWFNGQDQIVVGLTDPNDLDRAKALILRQLKMHRPTAFVAQRVNHSFMDLAKYRTILRGHGFGPDRIVTLGVHESANTVQVGISNTTTTNAEAAIRAYADAAGIPTSAVTIQHIPVPVKSHNLQNWYPGAIQGGFQIGRPLSGGNMATCSLGFPARRVSDGLEVWVTASHCTRVDGGPDGFSPDTAWWFTPATNGYKIGYEIADPEQGFDMGYYRNADAALLRATQQIDLGRIGQTVESSNCEFCNPSIEIDSTYPSFHVTAAHGHVYEGEILQKIGRSTGWTYGEVVETCIDTYAGSSYYTKCADKIDFNVEGGDSGGPVFWLSPYSGTVELRGIVFGSTFNPITQNRDAYISDLNQIQLDLGMLQVTGLSARIDGPDDVRTNTTCRWSAVVQGGRPPHDYRWQKDFDVIATGSSTVLFDVGTNSFTLTLLVTDADGTQFWDSKYVGVDPNNSIPSGCS